MNSTDPQEVSIQEGYNRWAHQYDQDANALIMVEERLAIPLLASISCVRVLDLGTGTGRYAIRLAAQGSQVIALDQSEGMLSIAKQTTRSAGLKIQFVQHRLDKGLPGKTNGFDLAISALVWCHIENLVASAQEAYRVLCPGGHLLVTDFHPAVIAAGWRTQFSDSDRTYLLPTAQHTTDDYLKALSDAGFYLQVVQEALVRDAPVEAFSPEQFARDGNKGFCLVILAEKR